MPETITIPYPVLSRNAVDKMHYHAKARLRQQYAESAWGHMLAGCISKARPGERYALTLTTYRIRLIVDADNLVGGAKGMIDALTLRHSGFIPDDKRECIGAPDIRQERCKRKADERTEITRERKI